MSRLGLRLASLLAASLLATCTEAPTETANAKQPAARLSFLPTFSATAQAAFAQLADFGITFDRVHVVVRRATSTADIVADTTVAFRPGQSDVTLSLTVPVQSPNQKFTVDIQFLDGTAIVFAGNGTVQSQVPSTPTAPASITVNYAGPGARVKTIAIAPRPASLSTLATATLTVTAIDSAGAPVTTVPIVWSTSDAALATITPGGVLQPTGKRGTVTVAAVTPTGISDQFIVSLIPPPAALVLVSGGGQSGTVGTALPTAAVVEVRAADGLPLSGIPIAFTQAIGGAVGTPSATSDANGRASTLLTLGSKAGSQSFGGSAAGFSVSIPATARADVPAFVSVVSGTGQVDTVGHAVKQPLVVRVSDKFDNSNEGVTVNWSRAGGGKLSAATSVTDAGGLASVGYSLGATPGTETIAASVSGVTTAAQFSLQAVSAAAGAIAVISGNNQNGAAGTALAAPFIVRVTDNLGNAVAGAAVTWSTTAGTIAAATSTDASGQSTNTLTLSTAVGVATITASIANGQAVTFQATSRAGVVAKLRYTVSPSAAAAGAAIAPPVVVALLDAAGNLTAAANPVVVSLSGGASGAVLSGTLTKTSVAGLATFDDLRIDKVGTGYVLTASSGASTPAVSAGFNVATSSGPPATIAVAPPGTVAFTGTVATTLATLPQVIVKDLSGVPVAGVPVTFTVSAGGGTIAPTAATLTGATGIAALTSWTLPNIAGSYTVSATAAGVTGGVTFTATATAGAAAAIVISSGDAQSAFAGSALGAPLVARVNDAFANPVAGVNVGWSVVTGAGTLGAASSVSDAGGLASMTYTLAGASTGANSIHAAILPAGTIGVSFSAIGIPAGTARTWTGGVSNAWTTAANWLPSGVPAAGENLFIPAGRPNSPRLTGPTTVGVLALETGSTLDPNGFDLTVNGNLDASGAIASAGRVILAGASTVVRGTLPATVVTGAVTANGATTVNGALTIQPGTFTVGANVTVTGNFSNATSGRLVETTAGVTLLVQGDAAFFGADEAGQLAAGTLEVRGNFTQGDGGSAYRTFETSGTHLTKFSGSANQSITFNRSGYDPAYDSWFTNLEINKTGGSVSLASFIRVTNNFAVNSATVVAHTVSTTLDVNSGAVTSVGGSSLSGISILQLSNNTAFPAIAGTSPALIRILGSITATGTIVLPATVLHVRGSGVLDASAANLTVVGDFGTLDNGTLIQTGGGSHVTVTGNTSFFGGDEAGKLAAGILELRGDFSQGDGGGYRTFQTSGTHLTSFTGSSNENIQFNRSGYDPAYDSWFTNLQISKPSGAVSFMSFARITNNFTVATATLVNQTGGTSLDVSSGRVIAAAGSSLSGIPLLQLGDNAAFPAIAGSAPATVRILGSITATGTITLPSSALEVRGTGGVLNVSGADLTIAGTLALRDNGYLLQTAPGSHVLVAGDASFFGGDEAGRITAGVLEVRGNFSQGDGTGYRTFQTSGTHLTRFTGGSAQSILFNRSGYDAAYDSWFTNLEINKSAGTVAIGSFVRVTNNFNVATATAVSHSLFTTLDVNGGQVTTVAGSSLAGLSVLQLGNNSAFPAIAGLAPPVIRILGTITAAGTITLPATSLEVRGASGVLNLGTSTLTLAGGLSLIENGQLIQTSSLSHLVVGGDASFFGGDESGKLTAGTLDLRGNFTQGDGGGYRTFQTGGAHLTKFSGGANQAIQFNRSGYDAAYDSWFTNLEINKTGGAVSINSFVRVQNNFALNSATSVSHTLSTTLDVDDGQVTTVSGSSLAGLSVLQLVNNSAFPSIAGASPPIVRIVGTIVAAGTINLPATALEVRGTGGVLNASAADLTINGSLSVLDNGTVIQSASGSHVLVTGDAAFFGGDESGRLSAGLLEIRGNFTQGDGGGYRTFQTSGTHVTRFSGATAQSIHFNRSGFDAAYDSWFALLDVTNNSAAGVTVTGAFVRVFSDANNAGRLTVAGGATLNVGGVLTLRTGSTIVNSGTLAKGSCVKEAGAGDPGSVCP